MVGRDVRARRDVNWVLPALVVLSVALWIVVLLVARQMM